MRIAQRQHHAPDIRSRILDGAYQRARAGSRNAACHWLAQQLRDNGLPVATAEHDAGTFAAQMGKDFSKSEALSCVRSAYRRPAREPWGTATARQPYRRRELTGADFDRMIAEEAVNCGLLQVATTKLLARGFAEAAYPVSFRQQEFHRLLNAAKDARQRERIARDRGRELIAQLDFEHADWKVIDRYCLDDHEADRLTAVASWLSKAPQQEVDRYEREREVTR